MTATILATALIFAGQVVLAARSPYAPFTARGRHIRLCDTCKVTYG